MLSTYPVRDMIHFMWKGNLYKSKLNLETEGRCYKHFDYIFVLLLMCLNSRVYVYDRIVFNS